MEFYEIVTNSHGMVSTFFTIIAIVILYRSIGGWCFKKPYTKWDRKISQLFLTFLYIQLILGVLLYFVLGTRTVGAPSVEEAALQTDLLFWTLEHFSIMIFSLFLSQIGWIFIRKSRLDINKHKNTVFYFGTSIFLIVISIGIAMVWR